MNACPIIVAEDDETDLLILRMALERSRLPNPLIVVKDGPQLVDYLNSVANDGSKSHPALLLLDLKLPKLNGFEILAWLRSNPELKDLPAVVLSSSDQEEDIQKARQLGASDYYVKPHSLGELVNYLHQLSTKWLSKPPFASNAPHTRSGTQPRQSESF